MGVSKLIFELISEKISKTHEITIIIMIIIMIIILLIIINYDEVSSRRNGYSDHATFVQCLLNVVQTSMTIGQLRVEGVPKSRVHWGNSKPPQS